MTGTLCTCSILFSFYSLESHPRRRNVTTSMVGLKNGHMRNPPSPPPPSSPMVTPRDIAGSAEEEV